MSSTAHHQQQQQQQQQAHPHNTEANRPGNNWPTAWFPLGYKDGFSQWWANLPAATAEHRVLSFVPYLFDVPTQRQTGNRPSPVHKPADAHEPPTGEGDNDSLVSADPSQPGQVTTSPSAEDPYGPRTWQSSMVELGGPNRALNELRIRRVGEPVENNLVILHGYGAGLGFFYKNFEPLSRAQGWQLFALDLLGMGRSTRPPFKLPAAARDKEAKTAAAEDWFVDALEEWRQKRNIERFTLMGHSLGGYMAVAYALKYPGRLNKLILASPVGIPEDPYAMQAEMPPSTTKEGSAKSDPPVRKIPKWVAYLWDANVSPFTLVRWAGPLGPRLVSSWTSRRFGHLPPDEASALHDYAYSLFRQRGSGEYALAHVLAPGAFARSPLIRRISGVGRQFLKKNPRPPSVASMLGLGVAAAATTTTTTTTTTTPTATTTPAQTHPAVPSQTAARELPYPVVFMYGSHDWMDAAGGFAAAELVNAERQRALADPSVPDALKKLDRGWAKVELINNAGHHLYLEGWKQFNDVIAREMAEVAEAEQLRRSGTAFGERDGASASGQS